MKKSSQVSASAHMKMKSAKRCTRSQRSHKPYTMATHVRSPSPVQVEELDNGDDGVLSSTSYDYLDDIQQMNFCRDLEMLPELSMEHDPQPQDIREVEVDTFNDLRDEDETESISTTATADDVVMFVPQKNNYMVLSSKLRNPNPTQNHIDQYNLATFNNSVGISNIMAIRTSTGFFWGMLNAPDTLPWVVVAILVVLLIFPWTTVIIALIAFFLFMIMATSGSKPSKRIIKWTIQDFEQEIRGGFLTCPPFLDKSGQWRLVVCQKHCIDGVQTTFGVIATDIPAEVEYVTATIQFSCTNQLGHELSPGMKKLKFFHKYECSGDCGYTRPIMFNRRQLGDEDTIKILCRIEFTKANIGYFKYLLKSLTSNDNGFRKNTTNTVNDLGTVRPETLHYQSDHSVQIQPLTRFVQHVETKTFVWQIPDFELLLKNMEVWGFFSPQFFVNSHDFCSIWRMKLLELHGVFRLHVQLRGLPKAVKQIKLRYLLQLVDSFGDSVVPEHSICRVKYPDHLNLWDTTRHILYRRETMVDRFVGHDGSLTLRLSLHLEPNELALLEADSDQWVCPN